MISMLATRLRSMREGTGGEPEETLKVSTSSPSVPSLVQTLSPSGRPGVEGSERHSTSTQGRESVACRHFTSQAVSASFV